MSDSIFIAGSRILWSFDEGIEQKCVPVKDKLSKDIEPQFTREDRIVGVLASLPPFKMVSNKTPSVAGQGCEDAVK
jgi:hypothetical protein